MDKPLCGVLLNLKTIEQFYAIGQVNNDSDDGLDANDYESSLHVSVYPQAFLKNVGHIQADGISPAFRETLGNINTTITTKYNDEENEDHKDDKEDEVLIDSGLEIVSGISSQVYNEMIHRVQATFPARCPTGSNHHSPQWWICHNNKKHSHCTWETDFL